MRKVSIFAAILLTAGAAPAQGQVEGQQGLQEPWGEQEGTPAVRSQGPEEALAQAGGDREASAPPRSDVSATSDAFNRACIDLLNGRTPQGEEAIRALQEACAKLMSGRAQERISAEERRKAQLAAQEQLRLQAEGRVQPGQAAAPVEAGGGVLAAFEQAGSELVGRRGSMPMGMRRGGPVGLTIITNPIGWFSGLGVNAEVFGTFPEQSKFSWVAGARYSKTDATSGDVSTFGAMGGLDWFIIGRNNEGLRVGPRFELAAGRQEFGEEDDTFGRLGLSGEVGYNFIASNGITGLLAAGVGGRVAGDEENEDFESFVGGEFGPYLKLGFGFSW